MTDARTLLTEDRTPVRWGAILGGVAMVTIVVSIAFGYLYLWANAEQWPPSGHEPIAWGGAALVATLTLVATLANTVATRGDGVRLTGGLVVAWLAGIGALVALVAVIGDADLRPTEHAYGSIAMMVLGSQWLVVAVATAGSMLLTLRIVLGPPPEWLLSGRLGTTVLWTVAVVVTVIALATVVAIPHLAPR